jgi:hypothetical protein
MFDSRVLQSSLMTQASQVDFSQVEVNSDNPFSDNTCLSCFSNITEKQWAWECAGCHHWVHHTCDSTIHGAVYRALVQHPAVGLIFLCTNCRKTPLKLPQNILCSLGVQTGTKQPITLCSIGTQTDPQTMNIPNNHTILTSLLPKRQPAICSKATTYASVCQGAPSTINPRSK